jgi:hypothetical protein
VRVQVLWGGGMARAALGVANSLARDVYGRVLAWARC